MLSSVNLGWIAGFLEGEGSFIAPHNSPRVSACQVQREPLERLQELLGGSISVRTRTGSRFKNAQPSHDWHASGSLAIQIMLTIFSLMSPRRRVQISESVNKWRQAPGSSWRRLISECPRGHAYVPANIYGVKHNKRYCRICNRLTPEERQWNPGRGRFVHNAAQGSC